MRKPIKQGLETEGWDPPPHSRRSLIILSLNSTSLFSVQSNLLCRTLPVLVRGSFAEYK